MTDAMIPSVDLHRHLEGSIRLSTVLEIARQHNLPLPSYTLSGLNSAVTMDRPMPDIRQIFPRFDILRSVFVDEEAVKRITRECLIDAAEQGLQYVELRFSPLFMAEPHGLDPLRVTAVVCEAWEECQELLPHFQSRLIGILSRTYGPEGVEIELKCALEYRHKGITGLDLAGDEARYPAELFVNHFERAHEAGLFLTAHAGEFAGAESVKNTVNLLGVHRLGHAVQAVHDPSIMDLLAEKGITIEVCPTSNLFTKSIEDLKEHPLPKFLERGIPCAICTDDPALFGGITIESEFQVAKEIIGLSDLQINRIRQYSWDNAFLPKDEKDYFMRQLLMK